MNINDRELNSISINDAGINLKEDLRMLWIQHVIWTRLAILSLAFDLPDVDYVLDRLLRNPKDFETALIPLYGRQKAAGFADLLESHLVIASQLVKSAKAGDSNSVQNFEKQWYTNADDIASFLSGLNPYWNENEWKEMLYEHLSLTKQEAVSMLQNNFQQGIEVYDDIEKQALEMADYMTSGIIMQFPRPFSTPYRQKYCF